MPDVGHVAVPMAVDRKEETVVTVKGGLRVCIHDIQPRITTSYRPTSATHAIIFRDDNIVGDYSLILVVFQLLQPDVPWSSRIPHLNER